MTSSDDTTTLVAAFYAFVPLEASLRESLLQRLPEIASSGGIKGSVLVAPEGVNGTVSGPVQAVESMLRDLRA